MTNNPIRNWDHCMTKEQLCETVNGWADFVDELLAERDALRDPWVSVDELPEPFHEVLITDGTRSVNRAHLHSNGQWMSKEVFSTRYYPTHWMEIPTPPTKGGG